jgi:hypothetical protein
VFSLTLKIRAAVVAVSSENSSLKAVALEREALYSSVGFILRKVCHNEDLQFGKG